MIRPQRLAPLVYALLLVSPLYSAPAALGQAPATTGATTDSTPGLTDAPPAGVRAVETPAGSPARFMVPYSQVVPGTETNFHMEPVPGGVVWLPVGPDGGEAAWCQVELPPFWIGAREVTWSEYKAYMRLDKSFLQLQQIRSIQRDQPEKIAGLLNRSPALRSSLRDVKPEEGRLVAVDAVTAPTALYDPSTTYESGEDPNLPAVTMTPFAARQYTKWLSATTGLDHRLPSEAEWLRAALADDEQGAPLEGEAFDQIAWHADNSDFVAHPVGQKAPNQWGLYDLFGNVAELVLDAHTPDGRPPLAGKKVSWLEGIDWPVKGSERVAKGGWWDGEPFEFNPYYRMVTHREWKGSDPNLPSSPWWFSDYPATGVGFRLVRPLAPIPADLKQRVWDTQDEAVVSAVDERLREGRGKQGPIGPELPETVEQLHSPLVQGLLN